MSRRIDSRRTEDKPSTLWSTSSSHLTPSKCTSLSKISLSSRKPLQFSLLSFQNLQMVDPTSSHWNPTYIGSVPSRTFCQPNFAWICHRDFITCSWSDVRTMSRSEIVGASHETSLLVTWISDPFPLSCLQWRYAVSFFLSEQLLPDPLGPWPRPLHPHPLGQSPHFEPCFGMHLDFWEDLHLLVAYWTCPVAAVVWSALASVFGVV